MIRITWLVILGFFIFASPVFAVSISISNVPSTITDQPFTFNISLNCSGCGQSYLRASLFPAGTTNYFGYSYNGNSFINSSNCTDYLPVAVDSFGNWSGTMQAQIDTTSSYYSGPGSYSLKVRRYTPSCSATLSNEATLTVNLPTPTQSPTASPTPTPTSTPSTSSSSSTSSLFTISGVPSQISSSQSFMTTINLSLPDSSNTLFYLKGAFRKADSTNYFGLTKVSGNWVKNNSSYSSQLSITTNSSGNWSGNIEVQPDASDSGFTGTDDYIFKLGRYNSSGSGPTWSNETAIKIIGSSSSSGNSSTTPSNSSSPTTYPNSTNYPTITKYSEGYLPSETPENNIEYRIASVAGISASSSASPSATVEVKDQKLTNFLPWIGGILILGGFGSLVYIYLRSRKII